MIKINEVIIVEGRYDKIKLSSLVDGTIIETEGFGIFKDKDKQKLIRKLAEKRGILIMTDSDSSGFVIRNFISSIVPNEYIKNAYIPDILGKEKRKDVPSKEGKLGVEGVSPDIIIDALNKSGVGRDIVEEKKTKPVTTLDFYCDGLTGGSESKFKRKKLLKYLGLPERMSTKELIELINIFMTYDDYKNALKECSEEMI